jgi:hypothetical protein
MVLIGVYQPHDAFETLMEQALAASIPQPLNPREWTSHSFRRSGVTHMTIDSSLYFNIDHSVFDNEFNYMYFEDFR